MATSLLLPSLKVLSWKDIAVPIDKVYYSDLLKTWINKLLYENASTTNEGQTIKLMLPIQVKDIVNE